PHRYPFLLLDKIVDIEVGKWARGVKNVSINEAYFQGHFPGNPIMPGVLVIEALAQLGAAVILAIPENHGKIALFAGMDKVRFKRVVKPGDVLDLEIELGRMRGRFGKSQGKATVDGQLVATAELLFMINESD
ncbi:MAG TPA: 3-hydroxyacyl-ACP dehydratase FabZ, partial [Actinobacteria bacterium]|nr:3-hydroxyacyl-ACP dehydratase FabZ [Actinomycetota bacterium]